jgi:U3 small nucleolar RNA-associated protein 20
VDVIRDLNSYAVDKIDDYDFDRRISAVHLIADRLHKELDTEQLYPVICNLLFYLHETETSLRTNASHALQLIIKHIASLLDPSARSRFSSLIVEAVLPTIRKNIRMAPKDTRNESMSIMGTIVRQMTWLPISQELIQLTDADPEADFFHSIIHIQAHRRARAIKKFRVRYTDKPPSNVNPFFTFFFSFWH